MIPVTTAELVEQEAAAPRERWPVSLFLRQLLGAGSLILGIYGLLQPARAAALFGIDEEKMRSVALRDVNSGLDLLAAKEPRRALRARIIMDVTNAATVAGKRPQMAAWSAVFIAMGVAAYLSTKE
jgi:hypothetical protein